MDLEHVYFLMNFDKWIQLCKHHHHLDIEWAITLYKISIVPLWSEPSPSNLSFEFYCHGFALFQRGCRICSWLLALSVLYLSIQIDQVSVVCSFLLMNSILSYGCHSILSYGCHTLFFSRNKSFLARFRETFSLSPLLWVISCMDVPSFNVSWNHSPSPGLPPTPSPYTGPDL